MVATVIVVLDEASDPGFEVTRQIVVLEQDAVLECLMPLRVMGRAADVLDAVTIEPFGKIGGDAVYGRRGLGRSQTPRAPAARCR